MFLPILQHCIIFIWIIHESIVLSSFLSQTNLFYILTEGCCCTWSHSMTHTHTRTTLGRTSLDDGSARPIDNYLTKQNNLKRQTNMPPAGFEPSTPTKERPQSYALGRPRSSDFSRWDYRAAQMKHNVVCGSARTGDYLTPLTPELNPSAQRCLTRFFAEDFASWTMHFVNIIVKSQQIHQLFIQFINYVW
jgi:hypothetical protein